jgi:MoxR-like ATPase
MGQGLVSGLSELSLIQAPDPETIKGLGKAFADASDVYAREFNRNVLPQWIAGAALVAGVPLLLSLSMRYAYECLRQRIGRPEIASEFNLQHWYSPVTTIFHRVLGNWMTPAKEEAAPIFNPELTQRLAEIKDSVKLAHAEGLPMQNVLLYGPGGTGKTMWARMLAKGADFNFVIMSGGDLAQFQKRGEDVSELNRLFKWINSCSRPTILFIDEAEGLCAHRDDLKQNDIRLQNAFLSHCGTESSKVMIVLATNRPNLDPAVLDRMDFKVPVNPPGAEERAQIILRYAKEYFGTEAAEKFFDHDVLEEMAERTQGMSGRTLSKLVNRLRRVAALSETKTLSVEKVREVITDTQRLKGQLNDVNAKGKGTLNAD